MKNVFVKPNVKPKNLFLVKARVIASIKSVSYSVYVHVSQVEGGGVAYAKCSCKAGQGRCCKHVAALLYTILDFANLNLKYIPVDLTCTQRPQKWSVPSRCSKTLEKAVKFEDLLFEKAERDKPNKSLLVRGGKDDYCASPPFARAVAAEEIKSMAIAFEEANRALLFCEAVS